MTKRYNKNRATSLAHPNFDKSVYRSYIHSFIPMENSKTTMKHRAISDIIAVLLLMGITVAGAVLVSAFFSGSNIIRFDSNNSGTQNSALKITGYDTRDGLDLSGIGTIDNNIDSPIPFLCTLSCAASDNMLPSAGGTEFIVLNVDNPGISKTVVQAVEINGIEHTFDTSTGGTDLSDINNRPDDGMFSIIETSNNAPITQRSSKEIDRNDEVRLVIKLSDAIDPDIDLNDPVRIRLVTNLIDPNQVVITSGSVR